MAKDKNGVELKIGDVVTVEAIVTSVGDKAIAISIENWNWISCPSVQVSKLITKIDEVLSDTAVTG